MIYKLILKDNPCQNLLLKHKNSTNWKHNLRDVQVVLNWNHNKSDLMEKYDFDSVKRGIKVTKYSIKNNNLSFV